MIDTTPRYTPATVMTLNGKFPVLCVVAHPIGVKPANCPIKPECIAVELKTCAGSRWYGVQSAHINSELRMVVSGFPAGFEEMAAWKVCTV